MKRLLLACFFALTGSLNLAAGGLAVSVFNADVTPPIGTPLCYSYIRPAENVEDRLTARGVVIFGAGDPIVLCVADFVGIANESHDLWREHLAKAAETTPERVSVHVIHNHDSPGSDVSAMKVLEKRGLKDVMHIRTAHDIAIAETALAIRGAVKTRTPVSHIGVGKGVVEKFASSRRLIGPDGKLELSRMSAGGRNPKAAAAREGVVDPELDLLSFWNGADPVAALTFYASHPQSYYGSGGVTPDTVGLARNRRTEATGALHIHFDGAGGDVAAGKYNDGTPKARADLTDRMEAGMKAAWDAQEKIAINADDLGWEVAPVALPWHGRYTEEQLTDQLTHPETDVKTRIRAARDLVYFRRWNEGRKIDINCLRIGDARVLFFPGELFVEYQLAAKALRPDDFIAVAAYGDGGPGYIGTEIAYSQGGYEVGRVSRVKPSVESILTEVTQQLLDVE